MALVMAPELLLLDAAHHHAKMFRFADYSHAERVHHLLNRLRHILREAFLDLQTTGEHVHNAGIC